MGARKIPKDVPNINEFRAAKFRCPRGFQAGGSNDSNLAKSPEIIYVNVFEVSKMPFEACSEEMLHSTGKCRISKIQRNKDN